MQESLQNNFTLYFYHSSIIPTITQWNFKKPFFWIFFGHISFIKWQIQLLFYAYKLLSHDNAYQLLILLPSQAAILIKLVVTWIYIHSCIRTYFFFFLVHMRNVMSLIPKTTTFTLYHYSYNTANTLCP